MIRWCAYCQSYMGESSPFDNFAITHVLCPKCAESGLYENLDALEGLRHLADFFNELRREVLAGIGTDPSHWVTAAYEKGIKPQDLLLGLIQPALYETGELWAKGEVTVAIEHRFSLFVEEMVGFIHTHYPELNKNRQLQKPEVLLTNANGNYHTLGLKFLEISLLSKGIKTYTLLPGLPVKEILELIRAIQPKMLGLSISMVPQARSVRELAEEISIFPEKERPLLLVGGLPVKEGLVFPPELAVHCCPNISDFPFANARSRSD